jgi:peptidoglycan/LPS O-acetylase OafA/YrhL
MSAGRTYPLGFRPELDVLRAVAVFAVAMFHEKRADTRFYGGFLGVDLFYVLSGALITMLLERELESTGRVRLGRFYARRFLRLVPALVVMVAATAAWMVATDDPLGTNLAVKVLVVLGYAANVFSVTTPNTTNPLGPWGHTWSLAQEEQFYLLWPLALLLLRRRSRRTTTIVIVALAVASAAARAWSWAAGDFRSAAYGPLSHADGLLVGSLVGLWVTWGLPERVLAWSRTLHDASVVVLVFAILFADLDGVTFYGVETVAILACANVVLVALARPPGPPTRSLLAGIGRISYGIYLWNMPVRQLVPYAQLPQPPPPLVWYFGLNVGAAVVSYFLVERPILRLRDAAARPQPAQPAASTVR